MDPPAAGVVVAVLRERDAGERRVALVPAAIAALTALGAQVVVEPGAGEGAGFSDDAYREAGAQVAAGALADAGVVALVGPPPDDFVDELSPGTLIAGFLAPLSRPDLARRLAARGVDSLAMELVPRITRAQAMDALSSQASVAGYRAVLLAAENLPRFFPMLMTAAGTIRPAKVLVLGAGVAGLQAIATARRLGAVVSAFDVRPAVREQVESLGATFLEVELPEGGEGEGGYARELSQETAQRQQELLAHHVAASDVVITTALVPGRAAPVLVTTQMVDAMPPGAVIVDLAAEAGGNCEATVPGEDIVRGSVTIIGQRNPAAAMPTHASQLYARNVGSLLALVIADGAVTLDPDDPVIAGACLTRGGEVVHPAVSALLAAGSA
jgi:NAD(P) transhydrogenase subunit alpha